MAGCRSVRATRRPGPVDAGRRLDDQDGGKRQEPGRQELAVARKRETRLADRPIVLLVIVLLVSTAAVRDVRHRGVVVCVPGRVPGGLVRVGRSVLVGSRGRAGGTMQGKEYDEQG